MTGGRDLTAAVWRGGRGRCPRCGVGPLFAGFVRVRPECPHCGEALHHQRADDMPPYIVVFIVGHLIVGLMLSLEVAYAPPMWFYASVFLPLTLILSLALLRPVKGAIVGLQWALRMHGFGGADLERT